MKNRATIPESPTALKAACEALHRGGIVVVPTLRWYMICAKATDSGAIERIFNAKQRSLSKQPLFILPTKSSAAHYFRLTRDATVLIEALWPGDLSLLLLWSNQTVASDFPALDQEFALVNTPPGFFGRLAEMMQEPLAATTVNISTAGQNDSRGPAISVAEVEEFLLTSHLEVDLVIDGGLSPAFNHSTIVDCRSPENCVVVREGHVHKRALIVALGYGLP